MKEEEIKTDITKVNTALTQFVAQWRVERLKAKEKGFRVSSRLMNKGDAILKPAFFWAETLEGEDSPIAEVELGIKVAAEKLKAGDLTFVYESGLGQIAWLSARAVELHADANRLDLGSKERARLLHLALKAQELASKLMLSLGGLTKLG